MMACPVIVTCEVIVEPLVMTEVLTLVIGVDAAKEDRAGMRLDEEPALLCAGAEVKPAASGGHRPRAEARRGNRGRSESEQGCGNKESSLHHHALLVVFACLDRQGITLGQL